ncbi:hypothetical protein AVEN_224537-1 [Araneus ventricosus]|uniref:Uncharacterized protein n=1 Tax=Araneus ventricosus TaxID=182803 RepID=A0A4Y2T3A4_ARAVE|nr:hypothetical protein AVEN_224537-1 [Araneus ventricosus]
MQSYIPIGTNWKSYIFSPLTQLESYIVSPLAIRKLYRLPIGAIGKLYRLFTDILESCIVSPFGQLGKIVSPLAQLESYIVTGAIGKLYRLPIAQLESYIVCIGAIGKLYRLPIGAIGKLYRPPLGGRKLYRLPIGAIGKLYRLPIGAIGKLYRLPIGAIGKLYQNVIFVACGNRLFGVNECRSLSAFECCSQTQGRGGLVVRFSPRSRRAPGSKPDSAEAPPCM